MCTNPEQVQLSASFVLALTLFSVGRIGASARVLLIIQTRMSMSVEPFFSFDQMLQVS